MAAQTHGLLIHRHLIGKNGRLSEDTGGIQLGVGEHLVHPGLQLGAVLGHRLGRALLHLTHQFLDAGSTGEHVSLQPRSLPGTHLVEVVKSPVQNGTDVLSPLLHILLRLFRQQYVGEPGQQGHGDVLGQAVALGQLGKGGVIAVGQGLVHRHLDLFASGGIQGDEYVYLSPGNGVLHPAFDGLLRKEVEPGHADIAVQVAVIDRTQLHRDGAAVEGILCPAVAGHTFDHGGHFLMSWIVPSHAGTNPPPGKRGRLTVPVRDADAPSPPR